MVIGRIHINLKCSELESFLSAPKIGYLHQAFHVFHYLRNHDTSWLPTNPKNLDLKYKGPEFFSPESRRKKMKSIYRNAIDEIPNNIPNSLGKVVQLNLYVDTNYTDNSVTRRSQTGIVIIMSMVPIY